MPFARVRFADDGSGTNEYICTINPYNVTGFDPPRTDFVNEHTPLDGKARYTQVSDDHFEKVMYFKYKSTMTDLDDMYIEIKSYEGTYKYFKDGDLGFYTAWTKMRIVSVERTIPNRYFDEAVFYSVIIRMKLAD